MSPEETPGDPGPALEVAEDGLVEKLVEITDNIRLASLIALAGIIGALYALVTGQITFEVFLAALAAIPAGAGVLGVARNGAGHGTSTKLRGTLLAPARLIRSGNADE